MRCSFLMPLVCSPRRQLAKARQREAREVNCGAGWQKNESMHKCNVTKYRLFFFPIMAIIKNCMRVKMVYFFGEAKKDFFMSSHCGFAALLCIIWMELFSPSRAAAALKIFTVDSYVASFKAGLHWENAVFDRHDKLQEGAVTKRRWICDMWWWIRKLSLLISRYDIVACTCCKRICCWLHTTTSDT